MTGQMRSAIVAAGAKASGTAIRIQELLRRIVHAGFPDTVPPPKTPPVVPETAGKFQCGALIIGASFTE